MNLAVLEKSRSAKRAGQHFPHVAPRYRVIQACQFDVVEDDEVFERCGFHDFVETVAAVVGRAGEDGSCGVGPLVRYCLRRHLSFFILLAIIYNIQWMFLRPFQGL